MPAGVVTVTLPLVPPPTLAVICVADTMVKEVAAVPPNFTAVVPKNPVPLIVIMLPVPPVVGLNEVMVGATAADISRMRLFPRSEKIIFPVGSTVICIGTFNSAEVAGPPSPLKPATPVPAMVEIMPFGVTLRMRLLLPSRNSRSPALSRITLAGPNISAAAAAPPSPPKPAVPVPA